MSGFLPSVSVTGLTDVSTQLININTQLSNLLVKVGAINIVLPALPGDTLFGNPTGSTALPVAITLGTGLSFSGSTLNSAAGQWSAGIVTGLGAGLSIVGTNLTTVASQWTAGTVASLAGSYLSISGTALDVKFGTGAVTAVAGAATLNQCSGVITSEALVAQTTYTLTLTNSFIASTSTVLVNLTDSAGLGVVLVSTTPAAGQVTIAVSMASLTGTVKFAFAVFN